MKFIVSVLLLGFFTASLVSARARHSVRQEPDLGGLAGLAECNQRLQSCNQDALEEFQAGPNVNPVLPLRRAGARKFCRVMAETQVCLAREFEKDYCQGLPDFVVAMNTRALKVTQSICTTQINDLEEHWDCLLSDSVHQNLHQCGTLSDCNNMGPVVECISGLFSRSPDCKKGADLFVTSVVAKTLDALSFCGPNGFPALARSFKSFLNF